MNNIFLKYMLLYEKIPKEIAVDTGLHINTVYNILQTGKSNNYKTMIKLKKYLKIPDNIFEKWRRTECLKKKN